MSRLLSAFRSALGLTGRRDDEGDPNLTDADILGLRDRVAVSETVDAPVKPPRLVFSHVRQRLGSARVTLMTLTIRYCLCQSSCPHCQ
jgi:hypothetical protein